MRDTTLKNKNKLYIGAFSLILVVIIILIFKGCDSSNNSTTSNKETTTPEPISIVSEEGDQNATIDANIEIRDVKFSKKIKAIKKYESKRDDTLDNPSTATSEDGYTYLSYTYNPEKLPTFFGTQPTGTGVGSMLTYVFYQDKLIEVRIQYGEVGEASYNNIVTNINNTYGNATYSRSYSNGAKYSWWKTDEVTLDAIYQDQGVVVYYRTNNK